VIDVGAASGPLPLYQLFPGEEFILIQAFKEFRGPLEELSKKPQRAEYVIASAVSSPGNIVLNVHPRFAAA
jgi:hypothetical protein